jgi:hypothetical protein
MDTCTEMNSLWKNRLTFVNCGFPWMAIEITATSPAYSSSVRASPARYKVLTVFRGTLRRRASQRFLEASRRPSLWAQHMCCKLYTNKNTEMYGPVEIQYLGTTRIQEIKL